MHLSSDHYRPVITGGAAAAVGTAEHLRLVSILIGAMRDECAGCVEDTTDAIALDAAATAVVHRIGAALAGTELTVSGSVENRALVQRLAVVPFPQRRQMVALGSQELRAYLDAGPPPPTAVI